MANIDNWDENVPISRLISFSKETDSDYDPEFEDLLRELDLALQNEENPEQKLNTLPSTLPRNFDLTVGEEPDLSPEEIDIILQIGEQPDEQELRIFTENNQGDPKVLELLKEMEAKRKAAEEEAKRPKTVKEILNRQLKGLINNWKAWNSSVKIIKMQNSDGEVKYLAAIENHEKKLIIPSLQDIFEYKGFNGLGTYWGEYTKRALGNEYRPVGIANILEDGRNYSTKHALVKSCYDSDDIYGSLIALTNQINDADKLEQNNVTERQIGNLFTLKEPQKSRCYRIDNSLI